MVFLKSIFAIVMPVSNIAIGDMQFPREDTADVRKFGTVRPKIPTIIPIIMEINIGFTRLRRLDVRSCLPLFVGISRDGTPHR